MKRKLHYVDNSTGMSGDTLPSHVMRVVYDGVSHHIDIRVNPVTEDYRRDFPDVESLLAFLAPDPVELPIGDPRFINYIIRESSMIAARTRRGAGNHFLHAYDTKVPDTILTQLASNGVKVVPSPGMAPDQAFIMYRHPSGVSISDGQAHLWNGQILDGPFEAIVHRDWVEAVVLPPTSESMGKAQDYCASFKII